MFAVLVVLTVVVGLTVEYMVGHTDAGAGVELGTETDEPASEDPPRPSAIDRPPPALLLDPTHVWIELHGQTVHVGADALALALIGRPERVETLDPGQSVRAGEPLLTLSRGERALLLRSPVEGTVEAVNSQVLEAPARLAEQPYGEGWICALSPQRLVQHLPRMCLGDDAVEWMRDEIVRLRETLAALASPPDLGRTAADGGLPDPELAVRLDDVKWQRLVTTMLSPRRRSPS